MKYESETGESMEKPGKKLKKLLIITGTTGAVYAGFKYLLPLVAPFFGSLSIVGVGFVKIPPQFYEKGPFYV